MSPRDVAPLPEDVAALLDAERRAPRPSSARERSILARVQSAVGIGAAVTVGVMTETSSAASTATAAPAALATSPAATAGTMSASGALGASVQTAAGVATKAAALALPASKAFIAVVAMVAGGAGLGTTAYLATRASDHGARTARQGAEIGGGHARIARGPAATTTATGISATPAAATQATATQAAVTPAAAVTQAAATQGGVDEPRTAPVVEPLPAPLAPPTAAIPDDRAAAVPVARTSATPRIRAADMAAESALLERARRALELGQVNAALAGVEKHARAYATGHLVEEREVLWVRALVQAGRREAAQRRAAAFHKHFPHSIQMEALDRALEEAP